MKAYEELVSVVVMGTVGAAVGIIVAPNRRTMGALVGAALAVSLTRLRFNRLRASLKEQEAAKRMNTHVQR